MKQIIPQVFTFANLLMGRVYLIEDSDGLSLIDAGLALAAPRILSQLSSAGYAPSDVKRILITHGHFDHIGGLPALKAATGAQIIASGIERPYIEAKQAPALPPKEALPPMARLMAATYTPPIAKGTPVDREVNEGDILHDVLGGLHVVATPGHSPGHTSYWQPQLGILFTGDVIMCLPNMRLPIAAFTPDMAQSKRSLQKIANLKPNILCFGHGVPMHNASPRLAAFASKVAAG
jgi:glyoxylase-like metal-dependent hydrolase (beta-lactamase superfamily II)